MARNLFTIDGLTTKLLDEISWRKKEIFLLKSKIPIEKSPLQNAMLRAFLPFIYAHWEGFVKLSMSYYLEYVAKKYLKNAELKNSFITLSMQNKLGDINGNSFENRVKMVTFLFDDIEKQSNIPKKNIINTKSNLTFDVLKEILFILNLDDVFIDSKKDLINDLVKLRNHIAHGEYQTIDLQTFDNIYDETVSLMEFIKTKIENNAALELYRKTLVAI